MGKSLAIAALMCLSFWFSYSSFNYARSLTDENSSAPKQSNVLHSARYLAAAELDQEIAELQRAQEFMVWPREAQKIRQQLITLLQQKQNLLPLNAHAALSYLAHLQGQTVSSEERIWALRRAVVLNRWQTRQRPILAYHCVDNESLLSNGLAADCEEILATMPQHYRRDRLLERIKNDRQRLGLDQ